MAHRDPTTAEVKIRVRGDLRPKLQDEAARRGMTLNAEIARRLEESFALDAKRRELDAERDRIRDRLATAERHRAEAQARSNQLTDLLLQQSSCGRCFARHGLRSSQGTEL